MHQFHETMQKGREGGFLRLACDVGLILSMVLWVFAQLSLVAIAPTTDLATLAIIFLRGSVSVVLALGCAVVLPALLAIIVPFTPAGQLLQRFRRATWGFPVMVAATGFLAWYAYQIVAAFWAASLRDPQFAAMQTVATLIIAVVVPALAFSWSSPLTWMAEVQQAQLVKKIELQHQAEIALAKTAYFRAIDRLRVGIANLTMAERQEVAGILAGLQRAQNDTLTAIAGTFRTIAGAELAAPTLDDASLVTRFEDLATQLEQRVLIIENEPEDVAPAPRELAAPLTPFAPAHPSAPAPVVAHPPVPVALQGPPGAPTDDQAPAGDRDALIAARRVLHGAWTRSSLESSLDCSKTKALQHIDAWKRAGLVMELTENKYHYRWMEEV